MYEEIKNINICITALRDEQKTIVSITSINPDYLGRTPGLSSTLFLRLYRSSVFTVYRLDFRLVDFNRRTDCFETVAGYSVAHSFECICILHFLPFKKNEGIG